MENSNLVVKSIGFFNPPKSRWICISYFSSKLISCAYLTNLLKFSGNGNFMTNQCKHNFDVLILNNSTFDAVLLFLLWIDSKQAERNQVVYRVWWTKNYLEWTYHAWDLNVFKPELQNNYRKREELPIAKLKLKTKIEDHKRAATMQIKSRKALFYQHAKQHRKKHLVPLKQIKEPPSATKTQVAESYNYKNKWTILQASKSSLTKRKT